VFSLALELVASGMTNAYAFVILYNISITMQLSKDWVSFYTSARKLIVDRSVVAMLLTKLIVV